MTLFLAFIFVFTSLDNLPRVDRMSFQATLMLTQLTRLLAPISSKWIKYRKKPQSFFDSMQGKNKMKLEKFMKSDKQTQSVLQFAEIEESSQRSLIRDVRLLECPLIGGSVSILYIRNCMFLFFLWKPPNAITIGAKGCHFLISYLGPPTRLLQSTLVISNTRYFELSLCRTFSSVP